MKTKIATGIVILAVIALISGVTLLAFAAPGETDDPVITITYLNEVFKEQVMKDVKSLEQELTQKFDARISALESQLKADQGGAATPAPGSADSFSVVTLRNGQSITCSVGTEIMLRIGTASGFGTEPALVNYTDGATLSSGSALKVNNMYLVTLEGNGIKATSDTVRILIRGAYKAP